MESFATDATFLFHKTNTKSLEAIAKGGLKVSTPQSPVEQILEYWRRKHFTEKPSRHDSLFVVTTLNTFFKTDMMWFGELMIVLALKFSPEILKWFRFYEYDHYKLMQIWRRIRPTIHAWFPEIWESEAVLTENEIKLLVGEYEQRQYYQVSELLNTFWGQVAPWDYKYNDLRALYCRQPIPIELIVYMIDVQPIVSTKPWPKKRLK